MFEYYAGEATQKLTNALRMDLLAIPEEQDSGQILCENLEGLEISGSTSQDGFPGSG